MIETETVTALLLVFVVVAFYLISRLHHDLLELRADVAKLQLAVGLRSIADGLSSLAAPRPNGPATGLSK